MTHALQYESPVITEDSGEDRKTVDLIWLVFFIPAYLATLYYGGSWAYCVANCGWGHVSSCENSWGRVKAVCWH